VAAQALLAERFGIAAEVYSATSWQQLRADALEAERWNRLHPAEPPRTPYVSQVLGPDGGPVVLVSDWLKALPDLLGRWLPAGYVSLGTEGFGRSDTREALRALFEIDAPNVVLGALTALSRSGELPTADVAAAIAALGIDPEKMDPLAF
jgi:pyruvate dehydrogenase E1 component